MRWLGLGLSVVALTGCGQICGDDGLANSQMDCLSGGPSGNAESTSGVESSSSASSAESSTNVTTGDESTSASTISTSEIGETTEAPTTGSTTDSTSSTGSTTEFGTTGTAICGDGVLDAGEACDDGNDVDDDECSNACLPPVCGDAVVQGSEECDDGNADDTDACLAVCLNATCGDSVVQAGVEACDDGNADEVLCTVACSLPACDDGVVNGDESDVDCGGSCGPCGDGQPCVDDGDCLISCIAGLCATATSCKDLLALDPAATSGLHRIDPDADGPLVPYDVHCDMELDGGGWTLVVIASDDGTDTWTWNKRTLLTTDMSTLGSVADLTKDLKSPALHDLAFADLLFVHAPSSVWAAYGAVGDGSQDLAAFMALQAAPQCDDTAGFAMTAGTLAVVPKLCSTDLYFHLGDRDGGSIGFCQANNVNSQAPTFGPAWSGGLNDGCPLDDPSAFSMGPIGKGNLSLDVEFAGLGWGFGTQTNSGVAGLGENNLRVYVRE